MMKFWIALLFAALAATSFVSAIPLCACPFTVFKSHDGGKTVDAIVKSSDKITRGVEIETCTSSICERFCENAMKEIGKFPPFNQTTHSTGPHRTVGDVFCQFLTQTVVDLYAGVFSKLTGDCKGELVYTGHHWEERLCCGPAPKYHYIPCK